MYENLPTGKCHVSFSEMRDWQDCSYRHKLKHVQKIELSKPGPLLDFGKAVHASCEDYLKTKDMKPDIAVRYIREAFKNNEGIAGFESKHVEK